MTTTVKLLLGLEEIPAGKLAQGEWTMSATNEFAMAEMTAGQLNAMVKLHGGKEGALKFLRRETIVVPSPAGLKVFKTLRVGPRESLLYTALEAAGACPSRVFIDVLDGLDFKKGISKEAAEVDLVVMSVADLGLTVGGKYRQICAAAQALGFELCPPEVGPYLFLDPGDQRKGGNLFIGTEPLRDSSYAEHIFDVWRDADGRYHVEVNESKTLHSIFWNSDALWVFVRPRLAA